MLEQIDVLNATLFALAGALGAWTVVLVAWVLMSERRIEVRQQRKLDRGVARALTNSARRRRLND